MWHIIKTRRLYSTQHQSDDQESQSQSQLENPSNPQAQAFQSRDYSLGGAAEDSDHSSIAPIGHEVGTPEDQSNTDSNEGPGCEGPRSPNARLDPIPEEDFSQTGGITRPPAQDLQSQYSESSRIPRHSSVSIPRKAHPMALKSDRHNDLSASSLDRQLQDRATA